MSINFLDKDWVAQRALKMRTTMISLYTYLKYFFRSNSQDLRHICTSVLIASIIDPK